MLRKMLTPVRFTKNVLREGSRVRIARKKNIFLKKVA